MTSCPNCGTSEPPTVVGRDFADARIVYYNCPRCEFSTWDRADYEPPTREEPTAAVDNPT